MSEENTTEKEVAEKKEDVASIEANAQADEGVKLEGLYAFKVGMTSVYGESGENIPVTVLKYEPFVISQIKTEDTDGYQAVQIACRPKKARRTGRAEKGHLSKTSFENGAQVIREIRQAVPEGAEVGGKVTIESLAKGDKLKMTAKSKGHGFAGGMKRWDFGGGPASHGSGFHRRPGSIGNRTWPGRVLPGKKMAGHYGDEVITVRNVEVVDVLKEESVVLVRGGVPGARNTLVKLVKEATTK